MIAADISRSWRIRFGILAVFSGHASLALIWDALPPVLVQIAQNFGGGARGQMIAQYATSLPFFGVMVAGLLAHYPVRRWGTRDVLLVALILYGIFGSVGAVIDQAWLLLSTRLLLGLAVGTVVTCCVGHVAISFDAIVRARMSGWLIAFGSFCGVVFILISGYVASNFGWRMPFLLHGVVSAAFVIPVLCMNRGILPPAPDEKSGELARLKPTLPVFALAIVVLAIISIFFVQLSFLVGSLPFGMPATIGVVFAILGCAASLSSFVYGRWFAGIAPNILLVSGMLLVAAAMVVAAYAWSYGAVLLCAVIFGTGSAFAQASLLTWAMRSTPPDLATKAMGLMFTCIYLGTAAGPALTASLPIMLGIRNLFVMLAIATVAGTLMAIVAVRACRMRAVTPAVAAD